MRPESFVCSLLESYIEAQIHQEEDFIEAVPHLNVVGSLGSIEIGDSQ